MCKEIKFSSLIVIKLFAIILLFDMSVGMLFKFIESFERKYYFSEITKYIDKDSMNECVHTLLDDVSGKLKNDTKFKEILNIKNHALLLNFLLKAALLYVCSFFLTKYIRATK
ncbi:hypothetical protein IVG45_06000 [Methylomonas sp. LL1]|uniref:hypothetical protein n=1 Tax=Methylomonas sp. LL1 TaxID=2785785 RepID=UPI0018C39BC6|nr:hypothetical protein [Methylomonas sp. LL1]QPK64519.1 hypothetical protein IVG45_06000 [Methylomonas sp. LL1]